MKNSKLIFRLHALQRMYERGILEVDVRYAIENGENIESYESELPYPSRLILVKLAQRPLHVVAAFNDLDREIIIITAYEPDHHLWNKDFKKRKQS
jgi:hypothetical protein